MSRIGKQLIILPSGVDATVGEQKITIKGPKGVLTIAVHPHVTVIKDGQSLSLKVLDETDKSDRALWGLVGALIRNMLIGVTAGYEKKLELVGVGYRAAMQGNDIKLEVGYSHPVIFPLPAGISGTAEKTTITISGIDKQLVGEIASQIRRIRKPEPYKGKGIRYEGEYVRRKAGKAAKSVAK